MTDARSNDVCSYEENIKRLEEIVRRLERGEIGLEEGLASFEEGVALVRVCQQQLERVAARLQTLSGDGQIIAAPEQGKEGGRL